MSEVGDGCECVRIAMGVGGIGVYLVSAIWSDCCIGVGVVRAVLVGSA